jgi:hypothetical protein
MTAFTFPLPLPFPFFLPFPFPFPLPFPFPFCISFLSSSGGGEAESRGGIVRRPSPKGDVGREGLELTFERIQFALSSSPAHGIRYIRN